MSFQIRNIREISNDPLTKFTNDLAKKLSTFLNKQETDKLENKEDIYSNGQDIDTVLRFGNLNSTKKFDLTTIFYSPSEPDFDKLKLWIRGRSLGNEIRDYSGFDNTGTILGDPVLLDGAPFDNGLHTTGTKSICMRLNRPTSDVENGEYISVPDNSSLQVSGISTGISYFIRFRIKNLNSQGSLSRTLFQKIDDSTPNNGVCVKVGSDGKLIVIIKRAGIEYKKETTAATIAVDTVYEVFITYAVSGNVIHVYINNLDLTLTNSSDTNNFQTTLTNHDLSIFRRGEGSTGGYVYGDLYDFEVFKEKIVSSSEVGFHYANKWTFANIPFGQVMVSNYWASYNEAAVPSVFTSFSSTSFTDSFTIEPSSTTSFTSTSFTSESFTTE